jgi:hypothetical protein
MTPTRPDIEAKAENRTWRATILTCPRCDALVLRGRDGHATIRVATVDPQPISQVGEAVALIQGRTTYNLYTAEGSRLELYRRTDFHIRGERHRPVVADHVCGAAPLDPADLPPPAPPKPQSFVPPF